MMQTTDRGRLGPMSGMARTRGSSGSAGRSTKPSSRALSTSAVRSFSTLREKSRCIWTSFRKSRASSRFCSTISFNRRVSATVASPFKYACSRRRYSFLSISGMRFELILLPSALFLLPQVGSNTPACTPPDRQECFQQSILSRFRAETVFLASTSAFLPKPGTEIRNLRRFIAAVES